MLRRSCTSFRRICARKWRGAVMNCRTTRSRFFRRARSSAFLRKRCANDGWSSTSADGPASIESGANSTSSRPPLCANLIKEKTSGAFTRMKIARSNCLKQHASSACAGFTICRSPIGKRPSAFCGRRRSVIRSGNPPWAARVIPRKSSRARRVSSISPSSLFARALSFSIRFRKACARRNHAWLLHSARPRLEQVEAAERKPGDGPLRVLFAGALTQRKGLADLFAAMKLVASKEIELVVMGSLLRPLAWYREQFPSFIYEPPRPHHDVLRLMRILRRSRSAFDRGRPRPGAAGSDGLRPSLDRHEECRGRRLDRGRRDRAFSFRFVRRRRLRKKLTGARRIVRASLAWRLQPKDGRASLPGTVTAKRSSPRSDP